MAIETITEKSCSKCAIVKPLVEYYRNPKLSDGRWTACAECVRERVRKRIPSPAQRERAIKYARERRQTPEGKVYARQYAEKNRERLRRNARNYTYRNGTKPRQERVSASHRRIVAEHWRLKVKYGLNPSDYSSMLVSQNGRCAICAKPPTGKRQKLTIDHDHSTGAVRSLLCHKCNSAIGLLNDDASLLLKAYNYLQGRSGERG